MPWATRGDKRYFYESARTGGKVVRRYVGHGPPAERAAAEVQQRRADRAEQAAALRAEQQRHAAAVAPLLELVGLTDLVMKATLISAGFHLHSRCTWRRKRYGSGHNDPDGEGLSGGTERTAGAG
jgi:hypothetical protein